MPVKKAKSPALKLNKKLLIVSILAALLIAVQGYIDYFFWRVFTNGDPAVVRALVMEANQNLYRNAPVDAKTGDITIPEARLKFTYSYGQGVLHYAYYPESENNTLGEEIYLSATAWNQARVKLYVSDDLNHHAIADFFEQVPTLQNCSRQFMIKFIKNTSTLGHDYVETQSITLADGRTAYLYVNNACNIKDDTFTPLYFKNLQSI